MANVQYVGDLVGYFSTNMRETCYGESKQQTHPDPSVRMVRFDYPLALCPYQAGPRALMIRPLSTLAGHIRLYCTSRHLDLVEYLVMHINRDISFMMLAICIYEWSIPPSRGEGSV